MVALVTGHLLHLGADALATEGVPLFWPVSLWRLRLRLVRTGDWRERVVAGLSGLVALYLLAVTVLCPVFVTTHPAAASAAPRRATRTQHTASQALHAGPARTRPASEFRRLRVEDRLVAAFSNPGHLLCDPFAGSGTVMLAALRGQRRFVGGDLNPNAVRFSAARLLAEHPALPAADQPLAVAA